MKVLRGKRRGATATASNWANDWIAVNYDGGGYGILTPIFVQLDADEIARFEDTYYAHRVGDFWRRWTLNEDGTFTHRTRDGKYHPRKTKA